MKAKRLLTVVIILSIALGLFPGETVSAAESMGKKWVLVETKINPDDVPLVRPSKSSSFDTLNEFAMRETSVYRYTYNQQYTYNDLPGLVNEYSIQFVFDKPPLELIPGNIFTLNIQGQMDLRKREQSGGYLGSDIRYIYREIILLNVEREGNVQQGELPGTGKYGASYSQIKLTVEEDYLTGSLTGTFVLDETWAENPDADEISITMDSSGYRIVWIYRNEGNLTDEAPMSVPSSSPPPQEEPDNLLPEDRQSTDSDVNPIIYVVIGVVLISIVSFGLYNLRRRRY